MRRVLLLVGVGAVLATAFLIPAPPPAPEPLAGLIIEPPGLLSPGEASIWYCPWAQSDASRDSVFGVASVDEATASFTLPVAIPGEPADTATLEVLGPGAAILELSEVARRGDSPGFIEFSDGPAAASVLVRGDTVLAADSCVYSGPDRWHFPGGSTMPGEHLILRLFNPFPEAARVTITGVSDIGVEALGDLRGISVGARSWRDIEFESLLRQRQNLVITVVADDGLIVPAMAFGTDADEDWWPGVGESAEWEFPVARVDGTEAWLVVANPGYGAVEVSIDLYTPQGVVLEAFTATVTPEAPARFDLGEYPGNPMAARVAASGPVSAAAVAMGEEEVAVLPGAPAPEVRWLLPGLRRIPLHATSLWLLNTSEDSASVTVSALTNAGLTGEKVVVASGRPEQVDVASVDAVGYLVESSGPITVAWSGRGPSGLAFAAAAPAPLAQE